MALKLNTPGPSVSKQAAASAPKASPDPAKAATPANLKTTFGVPEKQA